MASHTYDLLVIGGGPAGGTAASEAAGRGARVALVERDRLGGTCHNYGCDPTKTLLHAAHLLHAARQADTYGLRLSGVGFDWDAVQAWVRQAREQMQGGSDAHAVAATEREGIEVFSDSAAFVDAHTVQVGERRLRAERVVIATGTVAAVPPVKGLAEAGYITNVEAVWLPRLPRRLAVVGSGPLGVEFAQLFRRFGVEVTVLEHNPHLLDTEDRELAERLCELLSGEGIRMETAVELRQVARVEGGKRLTFRCPERSEEQLVVDEILVATGRQPALDGLRLEAAGVAANERGVVVDRTLRTSVPHIWAAGDIASPFQFTHVADEQGRLAARNAFAADPQPFDDGAVPWVTYTEPELAHVGKTEEQLREQGVAYRVAHASLAENERAIAMGKPEGMVKLLVDAQGAILGGHILAPAAGELIAPVALAMHAGLPLAALAATLLPYPTLAEAVRRASSAGG